MHCEACGFRYEHLPTHEIPRTLRTYPGRYARALRRAVDGGWARRRPAPTVWSPLEPNERSMAWVARHTVHELIHHLGDITQPDPAGTGATDVR